MSTQSFAQKNDVRTIAQNTDSIKMSNIEQAALRKPILRQASISSEIIFKQNVHSKLKGDDFLKSNAEVITNKARFKMPVVQWGNNLISSTVGVLHQHTEISNTQNYSSYSPVNNTSFNETSLILACDYSRSTSFFKIPVIYNLNISGFIDPRFSYSRLTYSGVVTFQIKRTANNSFFVGAVVAIDPSALVPFSPLIIYSHKFQTLNLELLADLPSRLYLRQKLSSNSFLSLGSEVNGTLSIFSTNNYYLPHNAVYATSNLMTGLLYEYRISRKIVMGINGGIISPIMSKMFKNNAYWSNDYFAKNQLSSEPYINVSISFLPFVNGFKL